MTGTRTTAFQRLVDQFGQCLTPDSAQRVADFRADDELQQRIDFLAERNAEGLITPDERDELDSYVSAVSFLSILQAKARRMLRENSAA